MKNKAAVEAAAADGLKQAAKVTPGPSTVSKAGLEATKADFRKIASLTAAEPADAPPAPAPTPVPPTPVPTPEPPAPPVPVPAEAPFFHGLKLSDYFIQPKHTLSEVVAPDGSGDTAFKFTVSDVDGTSKDPEGVVITDNPRGEMNTGGKVVLPREFWWWGAFWLPTDFPAEIPGWLNLFEGPYGKPYAGSPPVEISLGGKNVLWNRNATGSFKNVWSRPYTRGKKNVVLQHVIQSATKGGNGLVEMWLNGEQVCSVTIPTLDASNFEGPQAAYMQSYRQKGMFAQALTLYHWPMKLGTTRASVGG